MPNLVGIGLGALTDMHSARRNLKST